MNRSDAIAKADALIAAEAAMRPVKGPRVRRPFWIALGIALAAAVAAVLERAA